jgi:uncharacterized protein YjbJ (UPF0337 family)
VKEKWGKLTDDDLNQIAGRREQFIGKLQERYGILREEAQRQADDWLKTQMDTHAEAHSTAKGPAGR